jgi:CHAT domain-containing protein/tetratricopeptide (TPR) repeat protein
MKYSILTITLLVALLTSSYGQLSNVSNRDSIEGVFISTLHQINQTLKKDSNLCKCITTLEEHEAYLHSPDLADTIYNLFISANKTIDKAEIEYDLNYWKFKTLIARTLFSKGDYNNAEDIYLSIYTNTDKENDSTLALALNAIQNLCFIKKHANKPDTYNFVHKCMEDHRKYGKQKELADFLVNFGYMIAKNKPLMTLDMMLHAEKIYKTIPEQSIHEELIELYSIMGITHLMSANFGEALQCYKKALKNANQATNLSNQKKIKLYQDIARAHHFTRNADSLDFYTKKMQHHLKLESNPSFDQLSTMYAYLSKNYIQQGKPDSAIHYRNKALELDQKNYAETTHKIKSHYYDLSLLYAELGNYKKAMEYVQKNLQNEFPERFRSNNIREVPPQKLFPGISINGILQNLMQKIYIQEMLYAETNDIKWLEDARNHYYTVDFYVKALQESVVEKNFLQLLNINKQGYIAAVNTIQKLYNRTQNETYLKDLYYFNTALKGRLLAYQNFQLRKTENEESDTDKAYHETYRKINELKSKLAIADENEEFQPLADSLFELHVKISLIKRDREQGANIHAIPFEMSMYHASADTLMKNINNHTTYIEYLLEQDSLIVYVFNKSKMYRTSMYAGKDFNAELTAYRRCIKTGSQIENVNLYDYLIKPIEKHIKNKKHLVIVADNHIFDIPFDPITNPQTGEKLIENYNISYHYSGYFWLQSLKNTRIPKKPSIALFAPVFSSQKDASLVANNDYRDTGILTKENIAYRNGALQPLPYSHAEVTNIAEKFTSRNLQSKLFLETEAGEPQFRNNTNNVDILHVATHGISNMQMPEYSGLFFSQDEKIIDPDDYKADGFLHMNELYELQFNADLTILSACKSGVGKVFMGEGSFGLPRGFILAGTNNLIVSLWKIHDEKTANLINRFYDYLLTGNDYSESLRLAKLDLIDEGYMPIDWSGIILIGR